MSANESAAPQQPAEISEKSKGKSVEQHEGGDDSMMDEEEESSGEESGQEEVS